MMAHAFQQFVVGMGTPLDQSGGGLLQLVPFVLVIGVFYFLVLLPMKRRQKKVQEFQDALKVGDKVVTTGGIYGVIRKIDEQSVRVEIADNVRIQISKAAVGGYQGQEPVVTEPANQ